MPYRPRTHEQQLYDRAKAWRRAGSDQQYDRTTRQDDPRLAIARRIRSGARWQGVRARYLAKHPLCERCETKHKRLTPAVQVHHKVGLEVNPRLAFDPTNLESVCTRCHAVYSAQERKTRGTQPTDNGGAVGDNAGASRPEPRQPARLGSGGDPDHTPPAR